jgi:hypothetical protein
MAIMWHEHRGDHSAVDAKQPLLFGRVYKEGWTDPPWRWAVSTDERRVASGNAATLEEAKAKAEEVFRARAAASVRHSP